MKKIFFIPFFICLTHFTHSQISVSQQNATTLINGNLLGTGVSAFNITSKGDPEQFGVFTNGLSINAGTTLIDVYVTENNLKTRQILTESFSGVWSIYYKFSSNFSIDYTGNIYGPMRLPLLGENDPRPELSSWFSIQNIQLTKKFSNNWELYGGIKNLLDFTPPANSINGANNPFDIGIDTDKNPELAFDPSYVYVSNQGIRGFIGVRHTLL